MGATLPEYNGWANRPTWSVNLWLTNDEYTADELRRICQHGTVYQATDALQTWVENELVPAVPGMAGDLLAWALAYVDWREIVESNREEGEE